MKIDLPDKKESVVSPDSRQRGLELIEQCATSIGSALEIVKVPRSDCDSESFLSAAIVASIYEGLLAIIALMRSRGQGHAPTVARSMIESLADLGALRREKSYGKRLVLTAAMQRLRFANAMVADSREGCIKRGTLDAFLREIEFSQFTINELKKEGIRRLTQKDRFQCANLEGHYTTVYAELSSYSHGDLHALARRNTSQSQFMIGHLPEDMYFKTLWIAGEATHAALECLRVLPGVDSAQIGSIAADSLRYLDEFQGVFDEAANADLMKSSALRKRD